MNTPSTVREASFRVTCHTGGTRLIDASPSVQTLLGYDAGEFLAGRIALPQLIHADDRDIADVLFSPLSTNHEGDCHLRVRQAGGRILCVKGHYRREFDGDDVTLDLLLQDVKTLPRTMADITSSEHAAAMMENTDDYIDFKDRHHVFTGASQTLVSLTSTATHWTDLIGQTDYDVFPEASADSFYRLEKQVFAGVPVAHEIQDTVGKDGTTGWVDNRKYPIRDAGGAIIGLHGIARDITAARSADAALRESLARSLAIIDASPVPMATNDEGQRITLVNPAFIRAFGYEHSEIPTLADWWPKAYPDPAYRQRVMESWQKELARSARTGTAFEPMEVSIRCKDGTERVVRAGASPLGKDLAGDYMVVLQDITADKRAEQQLQRSGLALAEAQRLETVGALASGIAHDFNNLLAAIVANAEFAVVDMDPVHPAREHLLEIEKASTRAKTLVQQLLAFSRQHPQVRHPIALGPVVIEATALLRATIPAAVQLVTSVEAEAPPVLADAGQIHQILINLCTNAWHALDNRPGTINVHLKSVSLDARAANAVGGLAPGPYACLSVRDTGKGMDAATLERIFNPFFTTKEPGKGTGLGLSVVHGIVAAHQGAIHTASRPGEGTTFTLYFPASELAAPVTPPTAPVAKSSPDVKGHILYLDDEDMLARVATLALQRLGFTVTTFARPTEAVKAFANDPHQFDAVMTDMNMPEADGLSVARQVRGIRPDVPMVLVSGSIDEALRKAAAEAGIAGILCKPFTMQELKEVVLPVLDGRHP